MKILHRLAILAVVLCAVALVGEAAYAASNWIMDLNTSPANSNPSGFRTLPNGGMIFNANYLGDPSQTAQRLVVWNGTATFALALNHPREEPPTYFVESDTIGSWFYFISALDHQIYRTQGRHSNDWEKVPITTPANKRLLFVHKGHLVFEGFDSALTLPFLGVYRFNPSNFSNEPQLVSFQPTAMSIQRIETWSSCNNSLLTSARAPDGSFVHAISTEWVPFESVPDGWYGLPRPFVHAVGVKDGCCATTGHYMYCYNTAIPGSRLKFYGLVPSAIALNETSILAHSVDVDSANSLVTFVGVLDNWPVSGGLNHIQGAKVEPPTGAELLNADVLRDRMGQWIPLGARYVSVWVESGTGRQFVKSFDPATLAYGNTDGFDAQFQDIYLLDAKMSNKGNGAIYGIGRLNSSATTSWRMFELKFNSAFVLEAYFVEVISPLVRTPLEPLAAVSVPFTDALVMNAVDGAGLTQAVLWDYNTRKAGLFPSANYASLSSIDPTQPSRLWPFGPHQDPRKRGLVDYTAAIIRTADPATGKWKLTLATGFTHPDDRCDISTEVRGGITYNYADNIIDVVTSDQFAVLLLNFTTGLARKIVYRACPSNAALAPPLIEHAGDQSVYGLVSDTWCDDVYMWKFSDDAGNWFIATWALDGGVLTHSALFNQSSNATSTFPAEETQKRVELFCYGHRSAVVVFPEPDRLKIQLYSRVDLLKPTFAFIPDPPEWSMTPYKLVGTLQKWIFFSDDLFHVFAILPPQNESAVTELHHTELAADTIASAWADHAHWEYTHRLSLSRWVVVNGTSVFFFDEFGKNLWRITLDSDGQIMPLVVAIHSHTPPSVPPSYIYLKASIPALNSIMFVTRYDTLDEFYQCDDPTIHCVDRVFPVGNYNRVNFFYVLDQTIYWSQSPQDPSVVSSDEMADMLQSIYSQPLDASTLPQTAPANTYGPFILNFVRMPPGYDSGWYVDGVLLLFAQTRWGVEPIAYGPSDADPLPANSGLFGPLSYPTRIPVYQCAGTAPTPEFVCMDGAWTLFGNANVTSGTLVISDRVVIRGNLTLSNTTITFQKPVVINVTECASFDSLRVNFNPNMLSNETNQNNGVVILEQSYGCTSADTPTPLQLGADGGSCEVYEGQVQYLNSTAEGRVNMNVAFTVDSLQCKVWWIALAASLGGVILIIVAILLIVFKSEACRNRVMPYSNRRVNADDHL